MVILKDMRQMEAERDLRLKRRVTYVCVQTEVVFRLTLGNRLSPLPKSNKTPTLKFNAFEVFISGCVVWIGKAQHLPLP